MTNSVRLAVIGGGASGLLCAYICAKNGADVTLYEKNAECGRKLRITGKGRCNVCNDCTREEFLSSVVTNPKFLYSSYTAFPSESVISLFEDLGVKLKVERGKRVFPVSDKASDIVNALVTACKHSGVKTVQAEVKDIKKDSHFTVITNKGKGEFDKVIVATGGASYRATGSTGDGYRFAKKFGHTVVSPTPSLVPLVCKEDFCASLAGLSLKNVVLKVIDTSKNKQIFSELGEMLFTHQGVSGPLVLSASTHIRPMEDNRYMLLIDLKPALDRQTLDCRIQRDFAQNINRNFDNSLGALLPSKLIHTIVSLSGTDGATKVNSVTKKQREALVDLLKNFPLSVKSFGDINEAIITSGGVNTKEIDPKTMESRICSGLYFAGEVIDCDAYTGGFNLQIAFSTAYAAANAASTNTGDNYEY